MMLEDEFSLTPQEPPISVGIAGCGAMGLPMANNLAKSGFDVCGYDIRPHSEFPSLHQTLCNDAQQLLTHCSIVLSVVRDAKQTDELCFGHNGLFSGSQAPKTLVICSTLSTKYIQHLRQRIPDSTHLVDAPMSGAPYRAENGSLTFMLGGEETIIADLMPLFNAMGDEIHYLGPLGSGMTCKVLNNMLAATSTVAVRQVMQASEALGFPVEKLLEVARSSSGATWFGDNFDAISWSREGYDPHNTIGILEKDVRSLQDTIVDQDELTLNHFSEEIIKSLKKLTPN
ncbi:MAG: 3-hydroxyisobutyrate dehydrogenase-like beta-hydroxyacid dehydrogenase [Parasphingorhabdus sp.]|jgi:3-hydroxyisobutyrate dehydrogenase-like beta-hydroxyacid dehydrogenase